ncbi:hypothetical protein HYALB_00013742 [Hymenoscyphus albidus]|uniref:Uncharacterized protein n=1 Tax=Hymenoscyphus albidus TaxID=595503 RepID=A0A9N9LSJ7_9HELO|nr:hypothetical protein HYALB_00013742 [Hymenoscyphus albidus]
MSSANEQSGGGEPPKKLDESTDGTEPQKNDDEKETLPETARRDRKEVPSKEQEPYKKHPTKVNGSAETRTRKREEIRYMTDHYNRYW